MKTRKPRLHQLIDKIHVHNNRNVTLSIIIRTHSAVKAAKIVFRQCFDV